MPKLEKKEEKKAPAKPSNNGKGRTAPPVKPVAEKPAAAEPNAPRITKGDEAALQEFIHAGPRPIIYPRIEVMRCWNSSPSEKTRDEMVSEFCAAVAANGIDIEHAPVGDFISWLGGDTPEQQDAWAALKAIVDGADGCGALTVDQAKALLGWEDEASYKARAEARARDEAAAGNKGLAERFTAMSKAGFGDEYLLKDEYGVKVRCWNNTNNRDVDVNHARKHAQNVLRREWAGPSSFDGETVNGETTIVTRTGATASAQHRLVGLVLAWQIWAKAKPGEKVFGVDVRKLWPEEPFIESLVVLGISDDPRVIKTIDNVKPRSLADVLKTSGLFDDLDKTTRGDATRCLAAATDLLWKRTGAGGDKETRVFQTHQSSAEFLDRHQRLNEAVRFIVELNSQGAGRPISAANLQPSWVAAALYLMGTSGSSRERYRDSTNQFAFSEKTLDFSRWDKAKEFWVNFSKGRQGTDAVRNVLKKLIDLNLNRSTEKLIVVAKAWLDVIAGRKHNFDDLMLKTEEDRNGVKVLAEWHGFGGIDNGPMPTEVEGHLDGSDPEEVEAAKARVRREALEATRDKTASPPLRAPGEVRSENNGAARIDGKPAPVKAVSNPTGTPKKPVAKPAAAK